jgi:3-hydroxyacyl-[acyl-carrier-protein] dehydratase|tara:strand:+ start:580 stop:999 length:420 start_codon:yes stop_codon:yes gene_type:complete
MTKEQIKKIIPHREPFLLIDEINDLIPAKSATGKLYVRPDFDFFKGHFPQKPVMPGVLIVESLAQVGAVVLLSDKNYSGKIAYFTGIKNAKMRRQVLPGDHLILKVELTRLKLGFGLGNAQAYVGDELAVSCEISFAAQ